VESGDHQVAGSGTAAAQSQWTGAFVQRLRELGWTEGRNVAIEYRWGEGRTERSAELQASSHKPAAVDHQN
jgi:putative tryptophan/tyrosine transport system substrate-binding protein